MKQPRKQIFISRSQTRDSVFFNTLSPQGYEVHGSSLIEISPVDFQELPQVTWIFFYSKNGVDYFFKGLHQKSLLGQTTIFQLLQKMGQPSLAAIGPGTADSLEDRFGHPSFVGDGHANTTAEAFLQVANNQKVLFPRALNSMRSVQKALGDRIEAIDLVVYKNVPRVNIDLPLCEVLVFTSPLNVEAYYRQYPSLKEQKIIAIGQTTANALSQKGVTNIIQASAPSEAAMAQSVLTLFGEKT